MNQIYEQIQIDDLPAKVKIELPERQEGNGSNILFCLGSIITCVGFLFIMFGPDEIYFSRSDGATFIQFLQLYPGPIATAGGILLYIARAVSDGSEKEYQDEVEECLATAINIQDKDIPEGLALSMEPCEGEDNIMMVKLVEKTNENTDANDVQILLYSNDE